MSFKELDKQGERDSRASDKTSDTEEFDAENIISWEAVNECVDNGKLILCQLETDLAEHIVASLLYWEGLSKVKWFCVQVIKVETITEEKRCLILEIKNEKEEFAVKYFISQELGDKYFIEDFEFTRQSKVRLGKVKLIGAKMPRR